MKELVEAFEVHQELNPKIWDKNGELLPDVEDKIFDIVEEFEDNIRDMTGMEIHPVDVHLLGSNASYNYTEHSDLDVHLVVNFEMIDTNEDLVQALFNLQKTEFNSNYDISIHGIDVELYVEDIKAATISNGIYSLFQEEWIKKPEPITDVPEIDIEDQIDEWKDKINTVLDTGSISEVSDLIDELYMIRKNGLATTGEYGEGNQLFKEIRNLNLLGELKDKYMKLKSKELSLEKKKVGTRMISVLESNYGSRIPLDVWCDRNAENPRFARTHILVFCDTPYGRNSDDVPGVLFDGTFEDLVTGQGDNYIADDYSLWDVVDVDLRSKPITIFVDFHK